MSTKKITVDNPSALDRQMMARALRLARRGLGRVEPNPMVGCVIARGSRVIGEGYHQRFGGPHAEVLAMRSCAGPLRSATVYVTLEPCCAHEGKKTPPCVDALIEAGVARVVVGAVDPNPAICGRSLRRLRRAGVSVLDGVLADEATELIAPFGCRVRFGRPYVIAKWAQSLDGRLATVTGDSRWISGAQSRRIVHRLRARMDAVLVGIGTVLVDDPQLTARGVTVRRLAARAVLDSRLRIPVECQLVASARRRPTWVLTLPKAAAGDKADRLRERGVEVIAVPGRAGHVDVPRALAMMAKRGVTNLLVEGGGEVLSSFYEAGLVDEALAFVSPRLIGGSDAPAVLPRSNVRFMREAIAPSVVELRRSGDDFLFHLRFAHSPKPHKASR